MIEALTALPGAVHPIENYALIGNSETVALVSRDASIDWLGFPRFDSAACFAALLGGPENGRWQIAPVDRAARVTRRYRPRTLVLETTFIAADGRVEVIDCMTRRPDGAAVIRVLRGLEGRVALHMELIVRFMYGSEVPWVTRLDDGRLTMVAGPDRLTLSTPVETRGEDLKTLADFTIAAGQELAFTLTWTHSYRPLPARLDGVSAVLGVAKTWTDWSEGYPGCGEWSEPVLRSLITLKALTHHETGGIVAAGTTSLPERIGGNRNWDYRFCWLRDSTFTLYALTSSGFIEEAKAWREWLLRAIAGSPSQMQIMYGVAGERRLAEYEIDWLAGYAGSKPVRIGNAAAKQLQLDVYGEVMDSLYQARRAGLAEWDAAWDVEKELIDHLATIWDHPDEGIWEVRSGRRHFTHSKVMAWVALDRAIRSAEEFGVDGALDDWRKLRQRIHDTVCSAAYNEKLGAFAQSFGSSDLDAALLLLPLVGFLPPEDRRVRGTIAAIERHLLRDGFVRRYDTNTVVDGITGSEGVFLACSFWLADNYVLQGRLDDARRLFERLIALRNDVGLLAEEYDPAGKRFVGNFPQAFSHVALINTAHNLTHAMAPAKDRAKQR
ncbi:MAG TPA: glycoside hydrolase family 15 protein [Stellaceae bacterium]|nr:glycoside hydrolase family 15 protein [Stellaceae bacterium]